jgi:hypothetical protein
MQKTVWERCFIKNRKGGDRPQVFLSNSRSFRVGVSASDEQSLSVREIGGNPGARYLLSGS